MGTLLRRAASRFPGSWLASGARRPSALSPGACSKATRSCAFASICALNDLRREHPQSCDRPDAPAGGPRLRDHAPLPHEPDPLRRRPHRRHARGRAVRRRSSGGSRRSRDQEIERIFRILSLLYPGTDFRSAHYGLRSGDATARDNALEFLELALEGELRKSLVSLLDSTVPLDERLAPILKRAGVAAPTAGDLSAALVESDDPWLKACGISAVGALGLTRAVRPGRRLPRRRGRAPARAARTAKKQLAEATGSRR